MTARCLRCYRMLATHGVKRHMLDTLLQLRDCHVPLSKFHGYKALYLSPCLRLSNCCTRCVPQFVPLSAPKLLHASVVMVCFVIGVYVLHVTWLAVMFRRVPFCAKRAFSHVETCAFLCKVSIGMGLRFMIELCTGEKRKQPKQSNFTSVFSS